MKLNASMVVFSKKNGLPSYDCKKKLVLFIQFFTRHFKELILHSFLLIFSEFSLLPDFLHGIFRLHGHHKNRYTTYILYYFCTISIDSIHRTIISAVNFGNMCWISLYTKKHNCLHGWQTHTRLGNQGDFATWAEPGNPANRLHVFLSFMQGEKIFEC